MQKDHSLEHEAGRPRLEKDADLLEGEEVEQVGRRDATFEHHLVRQANAHRPQLVDGSDQTGLQETR